MNSANRITVLLAEDHLFFRKGLKQLLEIENDIEVIGEAANGQTAVELTQKLHPAVVIMDIAMPQLNGLDATRQILKKDPSTKVLILSAHSDDAYVECVTALGAVGYLVKQTSAQFLPQAIREVYKGNTFFIHAVAKCLPTRQPKTIPRAL
jgi:DNA-binding NarL/FixJ family response regulator